MYIDLEALRYLIYCSFKEINKDTYDNFIDKFQVTVSIEEFLEFLLKKNKITKYAINNFKITFPNQSYDNFFLFMKHTEIFDDELVSNIFSYFVSFYCANILFRDEDNILRIFKDDYKEMSSHFKNLYTYKEKDKFLRKTYSEYTYTGLITNEDKLTLKRSSLPKFLEDYKFCIETEDEDNDVFEVSNGVFLRRDKRDIIDELICQLEVLSINGVENELFEKLKKELGL